MGQKQIPAPVVIGIVVVVAAIAIFVLYKGVTGGTVGEGKPGSIQASPPMPDAAKNKMMQDHQKQ